jgi:hypothetical protein
MSLLGQFRLSNCEICFAPETNVVGQVAEAFFRCAQKLIS